ncbi:MAG: hypothetical protein GY757_17840, partial [bacterium]|nr:hypothetical protein [bacterium]
RIPMEATRIQASMDLRTGPLVKLGLFKTAAAHHLLIAIHHLVVDGVSWRILLEDIQTGLKQALQGEPLHLPEKTDSFKYWSEKVQLYAAGKYGQKLFKEKDYWDTVERAEVPPLPLDREIHDIDSEKRKRKYCNSVTISLDKTETTDLLKNANRAYRTEINDILLTALALALKEWNRMDKVRINLEGHGREPIIEEVDINRTVGWFTTQYPVLLDLKQAAGGKQDNIPYTIKSVKETLRQIPNKGINYGILRYLTAKEPPAAGQPSAPEVPEISFNYLGQFDKQNAAQLFEMSGMNHGDDVSPEMEPTALIEINGVAEPGGLSMTFSYNPLQLQNDTIERLATHFKSNLQKIIHHNMNRKETDLTPSDLGYTKISIERLDEITRVIKEKLGKETGINRIYPLSPMQKGMHFHHVAEKKSNAYFEQTHFTVTGELDVPLFRESFKQLAKRYDIFRTLFIHEGLEEPLQLVLEPCDTGEAGENQVRFVNDDITHIKEKSQKQAYLEALQQKDKEEGFDLSGEMPIRMAVTKTGAQSYHVLWSFYHIIMDGWCLGILFKDLLQIYRSLKEAIPLRLEPVTPYGNYIQWLEKQDSEEALEYWREYLDGYEQIAGLPKAKSSDLTHQLNEEYKQAALEWEIGTQKTAQLYETAQQNGTTLNQVMQTLWALLLMQYNNSGDVVFGAVVSGRPAEITGIEDMVGLFINTVPVRVTAGDKQEIRVLLKTRHAENAKTKAYEYQSLAEIQTNTALKGRLFNHIMVFENYPVSEEMKQSTREQGFPFQIESPETREQTNYSFNIIVAPGNTLKITFSYNAAVYAPLYVEKIRDHYNEILTQVTENPGLHPDQLRIITEKEKKQILHEFNNTTAEYPGDKTIHQLVEEQVEKTPDNIGAGGSWQLAVKKKKKIKDKEKKKEIKDNKKTQEQLSQIGAVPKVEGIHESPMTIPSISSTPSTLSTPSTPSTPSTHESPSGIRLTYRELNKKSNRFAIPATPPTLSPLSTPSTVSPPSTLSTPSTLSIHETPLQESQ